MTVIHTFSSTQLAMLVRTDEPKIQEPIILNNCISTHLYLAYRLLLSLIFLHCTLVLYRAVCTRSIIRCTPCIHTIAIQHSGYSLIPIPNHNSAYQTPHQTIPDTSDIATSKQRNTTVYNSSRIIIIIVINIIDIIIINYYYNDFTTIQELQRP